MKSRLINGTFASAGDGAPRPRRDDSNAVMATAMDQTKAAAAQVERVIKSYPVACLAAATVAGVLLGWWVKRK